MSRIGKLPITVPAGVTVTVDEDNTVTVKGPKDTLTQAVNRDITLKQEGNVLTLERPSDAKPTRPCTASTAAWSTTWWLA